MLSATELMQHSWATFATAAAVCIPGYALARILPNPLRARDNWAAWPTLGVAYWAVMLYLLPIAGGIWLAAAAAVLATLIVAAKGLIRGRRAGLNLQPVQTATRRFRSAHGIILAAGCAAYVTPLLTQHVPPGMDASRYTYSARLIGAQGGLPATLAPFAPGVPFGAANHGLPATAAVAIACGATPAAAILAGIPLSFAALILSLYLLLRTVVHRTPAAIIAVASAWLARDAQNTLTWGGFPCVLALAVAITASRILVDVLRRPDYRAVLPLAVLLAGLPLVHACIAAGWLYIGAPVTVALGIYVSRARRRGIRAAALGAVLTLAILAVYLHVARPGMDEPAAQWVRVNELRGPFCGAGLAALFSVCQYLARASGRVLTGLFIAAATLLVFRRRPHALAVVVPLAGLNVLAVYNAGLELLPGSLLLYPTRLRLFPIVAAALAIALAWRGLNGRTRLSNRVAISAAALLLAAAVTYNVRYFQRTAVQPAIDEPAWQALLWAGKNLEPRTTFVANAYGDAAAYLPGVAGIAVREFHANIADQTRAVEQQARSRPITHVFLTQPTRSEPRRVARVTEVRGPEGRQQGLQALVKQGNGELVFANESVEIYYVAP